MNRRDRVLISPGRKANYTTKYYRGIPADRKVVIDRLKKDVDEQIGKSGSMSATLSIFDFIRDMALEHAYSVASTKQVLIDIYRNNRNISLSPTSLPAIVYLCHPTQDHIRLSMCIFTNGCYHTHLTLYKGWDDEVKRESE